MQNAALVSGRYPADEMMVPKMLYDEKQQELLTKDETIQVPYIDCVTPLAAPRCQSWGRGVTRGSCRKPGECGQESPAGVWGRLNRYKILSVNGRKFNELNSYYQHIDSIERPCSVLT